MADDTNTNPDTANAQNSGGAPSGANPEPAAPPAPAPTSAPAIQEQQAAPAKTFLQALEVEVKRAEAAGEHAVHAVLNDLHMLSVQVKSKAAASLGAFEGDAGDMVQFLHDML